MIIGRGLLANVLRDIDNEKHLFYANGISNSVLENIPKNNFEIKEIEEIAKQNNGKTFIYFSTCQVNSELNHHRAYVKHKLFLEHFISKNFQNYLIIRTTNLVGHNPWNIHTLFNFLYHAITVNEQITINPVLKRNFLDANHFSTLLKGYLQKYPVNKTIEVVNPLSFSMGEIIDEFEKCFLKKFKMKRETETNDFAFFELNNQLSSKLFKVNNISTQNYIPDLLKKYYLELPVEN